MGSLTEDPLYHLAEVRAEDRLATEIARVGTETADVVFKQHRLSVLVDCHVEGEEVVVRYASRHIQRELNSPIPAWDTLACIRERRTEAMVII